jgi:hypothetical protein
VRSGASKSDSTHHFFRNACTKTWSLRVSQFYGCWLILSVYMHMSFDFPFVSVVKVWGRPICGQGMKQTYLWSRYEADLSVVRYEADLSVVKVLSRPICGQSISQFSGCWLILSVYILMSFDFPFVRLFGVR